LKCDVKAWLRQELSWVMGAIPSVCRRTARAAAGGDIGTGDPEMGEELVLVEQFAA
jgi:hypothetical protein